MVCEQPGFVGRRIEVLREVHVHVDRVGELLVAALLEEQQRPGVARVEAGMEIVRRRLAEPDRRRAARDHRRFERVHECGTDALPLVRLVHGEQLHDAARHGASCPIWSLAHHAYGKADEVAIDFSGQRESRRDAVVVPHLLDEDGAGKLVIARNRVPERMRGVGVV